MSNLKIARRRKHEFEIKIKTNYWHKFFEAIKEVMEQFPKEAESLELVSVSEDYSLIAVEHRNPSIHHVLEGDLTPDEQIKMSDWVYWNEPFSVKHFAEPFEYSVRISHACALYSETSGIITSLHPSILWNTIYTLEGEYSRIDEEGMDIDIVIYLLSRFYGAIPIGLVPEAFDFDLDIHANWDVGCVDPEMKMIGRSQPSPIKLEEVVLNDIRRIATTRSKFLFGA